MKTSKAVCDLHPWAELLPTVLRTHPPYIDAEIPGEAEGMHIEVCTHEGCARCYRSDHGYFFLTKGSPLDYGDEATLCDRHSYRQYKRVTKNESGGLVWECASETCISTDEFSPPKIRDAVFEHLAAVR